MTPPSPVLMPKLTRSGAFYMLLPVLLLGAGVVGWIAMLGSALGDPSVAIEPDYYNQATHIDREKAMLVRSSELGWSARVESFVPQSVGDAELTLKLEDRDGRGLSGLSVNVVAFPNVRSSDRQSVLLAQTEPGKYSARVARARLGIWELRVVAARDGDEFHATIRHELVDPRGRR